MERMTLAEYLDWWREAQEDIDIYVDGVDAVAYCGTIITDYGKEYYKDALALPVEDGVVISDNDDDYELLDDEDGALALAYRLLLDMAGYCGCEHYDKCFK